jgi:hypothetical protein
MKNNKKIFLGGIAACFLAIIGLGVLISCGHVVRPIADLPGISNRIFLKNCAVQTSGATREVGQTYTVTGHVYDRTTRAPIAGAHVITGYGDVAITGSDGSFVFSDVPGGSVLFVAHDTREVSSDNQAGAMYHSLGIETASSAINFYLSKSILGVGLGNVEVTVLNQDGTPVDKAMVLPNNIQYFSTQFDNDAETGSDGKIILPCEAGRTIFTAGQAAEGAGQASVVTVSTSEPVSCTIYLASVEGIMTGEVTVPSGFAPEMFIPIFPTTSSTDFLPYYISMTSDTLTYTATLFAGSNRLLGEVKKDVDGGQKSLMKVFGPYLIGEGTISKNDLVFEDYSPTIIGTSTFEQSGMVFMALTWEAPAESIIPSAYVIEYATNSPEAHETLVTKSTSLVFPFPTGSEVNYSVATVALSDEIDLDNLDLLNSNLRVLGVYRHEPW